MTRDLQPLVIDPADLADPQSDVLHQLKGMLNGNVSLLPLPIDPIERSILTSALRPGEPIDESVGCVVATSGSTGNPKGAMLTASALHASDEATSHHLGGPGAWLLTLPAHHIAGLQVVLRSLAAGMNPAVMPSGRSFNPDAFVNAIDNFPDGGLGRRYTSLVPTQLIKVLNDPRAAAAAAQLDAILVGGAATPAHIIDAARTAGLKIVRTYGMSETCGGCVYDGYPLNGVGVSVDRGRVVLSGPVIASGYRNPVTDSPFSTVDTNGGHSIQQFRTDDIGEITDGRLSILGRADEAISSGGLTIIPQVVERVIGSVSGICSCAVFATSHHSLGQQVCAAIVLDPQGGSDVQKAGNLRTVPSVTDITEAITNRVRSELGTYAVPRRIFALDSLPLRGPGKVNRRRLTEMFDQ